MALLLLIRHASTAAVGTTLVGWTPGIPLDERGRDQAARLGERLREVPLAAVYSSPLERCTETADAVAAARGLEVRTEDRLGEVRYGAWTGRPLRSLVRTKLWQTVQKSPSLVRFPDGERFPGESFAECQRRAVDALDAISATHGRRIVAAVTHADVIRLVLAHYAGVHLDLFQRLVVSPASVSAVALSRSGPPHVLRVNDTGGMDDLVPPRRPRRKPSKGRVAG